MTAAPHQNKGTLPSRRPSCEMRWRRDPATDKKGAGGLHGPTRRPLPQRPPSPPPGPCRGRGLTLTPSRRDGLRGRCLRYAGLPPALGPVGGCHGPSCPSEGALWTAGGPALRGSGGLRGFYRAIPHPKGVFCIWGGGGGGRGFGTQKCADQKWPCSDIPIRKFRFFPRWSLWSGGGGGAILLF